MRISAIRATAISLASAATASVLIAGCSSSGTAGSTDTGDGSRSGSSADTLSGTQLTAYLPSDTDVPAGWTAKQDGTFNSVGSPRVPYRSAADLPPIECSHLAGNAISGTLLTGLSASMAQKEFELPIDSSGNPGPEGLFAIMQARSYAAGGVTQQLALIRATADKCASFTATGSRQSGGEGPIHHTITAAPVTGLGDEAVEVTDSSDEVLGPEQVLIASSGDILLSAEVDGGTAAGPSHLTQIITKMLAKLPKK